MRSAFEVKVSRQDFLKELTNPEKNEWARKSCNEFWFVAPGDVIKEQELPEGVGWMKPRGDTLAIVRHAQRKQAEAGPELIAAIARSIQKAGRLDEAAVKSKILAEDKDHQRYKRITEELKAFIRKSGGGVYDLEKEGGVERILSEVMLDDKAAKERSQISSVTRSFQERMARLFDDFLVVAYMSMLECNKMGNFVVEKYGASEEVATMAEMRALLSKPNKGMGSYSSSAKSIVSAFDRMRRLKGKQDAERQG